MSWDEEEERTYVDDIGDTLDTINFWLGNGSIVIHTTILIFFAVNFIKRDPNINSAYFNMLFFCCFFEWLRLISWSGMMIHDFWDFGSFWHHFSGRTEWYSVLYSGCWNTALAINRFTAIMVPMKYKRIWTGKSFCAILLGLILYPFIIDFPTIYNFSMCWYAYEWGKCIPFGEHYQKMQIISNVINVVFSMGISISTVIANRTLKIVKQNNFERRLFYQSLWSLIWWTLQTVIFMQAVLNVAKVERSWLKVFLQSGYIVLGFYHYSTIAILFFLSKPFRDKFKSFYFPCWNKQKVIIITSTTGSTSNHHKQRR